MTACVSPRTQRRYPLTMICAVARRYEPEIIDRQVPGSFRVLALLNPFSLERIDRSMPEGRTLQQVVDELGITDWRSARICIDGIPATREDMWSRIRPKAGSVVTIRCVPQGTGGGGNK